MAEIVFNSGDYATLLADAERLGFTYTDQQGEKQIQISGPMASGGGYFLNIVGVIYEPQTPTAPGEDPPAPVARPGYWGRLRANGSTSDLPPFSPSIIQYFWSADVGPVNPDTGLHSGGWTADGVTLAPDWVGTIGMIA